jgi:3-dehydroquinate dehydratase II
METRNIEDQALITPMLRIAIINGPNLNLLGQRNTTVYGHDDFDSFFMTLRKAYADVQLDYFQSNIEGEIINKLHEKGFSFDGIILNPGGYTHTSVAIRDAVEAITTPVIEVHLSNIHAREDFRHQSLTSFHARGMISGFGLASYEMAVSYYLDYMVAPKML